jgi:plasmid stabilization system protein ParE
MSLPVIFRPEADHDALTARDWYDRQRSGLGAIFASRLASAIDRIGQSPEVYGEVGLGVRAAPVRRHPYVVYYRIRPNHVEVLAVLHGRRKSSAWRRRV